MRRCLYLFALLGFGPLAAGPLVRGLYNYNGGETSSRGVWQVFLNESFETPFVGISQSATKTVEPTGIEIDGTKFAGLNGSETIGNGTLTWNIVRETDRKAVYTINWVNPEGHYEWNSGTLFNGGTDTLNVVFTINEGGSTQTISDTVEPSSSYRAEAVSEQEFEAFLYVDAGEGLVQVASGLSTFVADDNFIEYQIINTDLIVDPEDIPVPDPDNPNDDPDPEPEPDPEDPLPPPDPNADDTNVADRNHTQVTIDQNTENRNTLNQISTDIQNNNDENTNDIVNELKNQGNRNRQHLTDVYQSHTNNQTIWRNEQRDQHGQLIEAIENAEHGQTDDEVREFAAETEARTQSEFDLQQPTEAERNALSQTAVDGYQGTIAQQSISGSQSPTLQLEGYTIHLNPFEHHSSLATLGSFLRTFLIWVLTAGLFFLISKDAQTMLQSLSQVNAAEGKTSVMAGAVFAEIESSAPAALANAAIIIVALAAFPLAVFALASTTGINLSFLSGNVLGSAPSAVQFGISVVDSFFPVEFLLNSVVYYAIFRVALPAMYLATAFIIKVAII